MRKQSQGGSRPQHSAPEGPRPALPRPAPNPAPAPPSAEDVTKKDPKSPAGRPAAAQPSPACLPAHRRPGSSANGPLLRPPWRSEAPRRLGVWPPPSRLSRSTRTRRPEGGGNSISRRVSRGERAGVVGGLAAVRRRSRGPAAASKLSAGRGARTRQKGTPVGRRRQSEWSAQALRPAAAA